jgi:glycerol-3-phosphate acyltransferase PlsX
VPTIAVDAVGGARAPEEIVAAVAEISVATDIECVLVGDEARVQACLDDLEYAPERIAVLHSGERPGATRNPDALGPSDALAVGLRALLDGRADGFVSAGSSRACIAACGRLLRAAAPKVAPALATVIPRQIEYEGQDPLALLLDVGAAVRADANGLVDFAIMGTEWARGISKVRAPRVALLGMGPSMLDDDDMYREVAGRLARDPRVSFVGVLEGSELMTGRADVVVCEGIVGRVTRTLFEQVSAALVGATQTAGGSRLSWRLGMRLLADGIERVRALTDYTRYGGAPVLGFERAVLTIHPQSSSRAVANAVKVAAKAVRDDVPAAIVRALAGKADV